jgi:hypothetical protein
MIAQLSKDYLKIGGIKKTLKRLLIYFFEGRPLTTKGRFFNFLVFPLLYFISRFYPKKDGLKLKFILGQGRSGSTYLGLLLSLLKGHCFLNEPKLPWAIANKNDDLVGSYKKKVGSYFILDNSSIIVDRIIRIYSFLSFLTNSRILVDKYPEMIFRLNFLYKNFNNSEFIILYRDYQSIIRSIPGWNKKHSSDNSNWWGKNNQKWLIIQKELIIRSEALSEKKINFDKLNDYEKSIVEWILTVETTLNIIKKFKNVKIINYDELIISMNFYLKDYPEKNKIKCLKYFKKTLKTKTYKMKDKEFFINKNLLIIANKLKSNFEFYWIEYKKNNLL